MPDTESIYKIRIPAYAGMTRGQMGMTSGECHSAAPFVIQLSSFAFRCFPFVIVSGTMTKETTTFKQYHFFNANFVMPIKDKEKKPMHSVFAFDITTQILLA